MTTRIRFLGEVPASTVAGTFNTADVSLTIASASGQPSTFPFDAVISRTVPAKRERIRVGGMAGAVYNTITRAIDGTTAKLHDVGETVELCISASYLDELGQFLGGTAGDLYYYGGTNVSRLGIGAANTIAKSTGAAPAWATQSALLDTLGSPINQQALVRQGGVWVPTFLTLPQYASTAAATTAGANVDGAVIYVNSADSAEGLYSFNATSWRPVSWNAPWGMIVKATDITASQAAIGTTATDLTGFTGTFTAVSTRYYRATASVGNVSFPNGGVHFLLTDGSNVVKSDWQFSISAAGGGTYAGVLSFVLTGLSGSTTLKMRANAITAGNVVPTASASQPSQFFIEDIGPSGNPA